MQVSWHGVRRLTSGYDGQEQEKIATPWGCRCVLNSIVLINPPLSLEERYGTWAKGGTRTPPLGLAQLAAVTREQGYPTRIIDCAALELDDDQTVQSLLATKPRYIGLTATTVAICNAGDLARKLKDANKDWVIIIGGPHITALPEETMRAFPAFDVGVIGEGEATIIELLDALEAKRPLRLVKGLIIRENDELVRTESRPFIEDLDTLPLPAWDLLPNLARHYDTPTFSLGGSPASSLVTSRGCCGRCTFCDRSVFGNVCRFHSAERVFECMRHLHEHYGINDIIIHDDAFVIDRRRVEKVCHLLIESGLGVTWGCNARVNLVSPDLLQLMRKAGCWQIGYGIETGSQRILDIINKGVRLEQIREAVRCTREAGIRTRGFFMIGHPGENEESIRETIAFVKTVPVDDFQITLFTPLPGSEVYRKIHEYGVLDDDWRKMNMWTPVFTPTGLTARDLVYWQRRAFRAFYLRPRTIWSYLKIVRSPRHLRKLFTGGLTLIQNSLKSIGTSATMSRGVQKEDRP